MTEAGGPLDALTSVVQRLDRLAIAYMITGSVAAYFYGLNRATADVDIIVDIRATAAARIVEVFRDAFFVQESQVRDAKERGILFNVISNDYGGKFDLIPLENDPFELSKFGRRQPVEWHGYPMWISTPADLVISKLRWARETHSEQQFRDVRAIMSLGLIDDDEAYFHQWIAALELGDVLELARSGRHDA